MRPSRIIVGLALAGVWGCARILGNDYQFDPEPRGEAGAAGAGATAGGAGETSCSRGGELARVRFVNLLADRRPVHVCTGPPIDDFQYFSALSIPMGFPDGIASATMSRFAAVEAGETSFGVDDPGHANPCRPPANRRSFCLRPGSYSTVVIAGEMQPDDGGAPWVRYQHLGDMGPEKPRENYNYVRFSYSMAPRDPGDAAGWLDVLLWPRVTGEWIKPARNLSFSGRPVGTPKQDPFYGVTSLGYVEAAPLYTFDQLHTIELVLPLQARVAATFQLPAELGEVLAAAEVDPVLSVFAWGDASPSGKGINPSHDGVELLACIDDSTSAAGPSACYPMKRGFQPSEGATPGYTSPPTRLRIANLTPEPRRYCMLSYTASVSVAKKGNLAGWSAMSPLGIELPPWTVRAEQLTINDSMVIVPRKIEDRCTDSLSYLGWTPPDIEYDCRPPPASGRCALIDSWLGNTPAGPRVTMVDEASRSAVIYEIDDPVEGKVVARLANLLHTGASCEGYTACSLASLSWAGFDGATPWPDAVKPSGPSPAPEHIEPLATFSPLPGAHFVAAIAGGPVLRTPNPVAFAGSAGASFSLWLVGDLSQSDTPGAPRLHVCNNQTSADTLDCESHPLVAQP